MEQKHDPHYANQIITTTLGGEIMTFTNNGKLVRCRVISPDKDVKDYETIDECIEYIEKVTGQPVEVENEQLQDEFDIPGWGPGEAEL